MCNTCNSSRSGCYAYTTSRNTDGCGYTTPRNTDGCCGYATPISANGGVFWGLNQRLCRDCNGNIRVINNRSTCGCHCCCPCCCCPCHCGCGCSNGGTESNDGDTSGNGNGGYACLTVCGVATTATANAVTGDDYYARQYALNRRSGRSSCNCGCGG